MQIKKGYTVEIDTSIIEALFDGEIRPLDALSDSGDIFRVNDAINTIQEFEFSIEKYVEEY